MLTTPDSDQGPILVVQEEHAFQIRPRRRTSKPPVRSDLIISLSETPPASNEPTPPKERETSPIGTTNHANSRPTST